MKSVVVRSSVSGVWMGTLVSEPVIDGPGTVQVRLVSARRIWEWVGAGSCSGLAAHGPRAGKIAPPVDALVGGCCEVLDATPTAVAAVAAIPEWRP